MSKTLGVSQHIEITPGICGGSPRLASHRIKVEDVVICHEKMGLSPDEIVSQYPGISLSDVYAALAYYHDNLELIRKQIEENESYAKIMKAKSPSLLKQKLKVIHDNYQNY